MEEGTSLALVLTGGHRYFRTFLVNICPYCVLFFIYFYLLNCKLEFFIFHALDCIQMLSAVSRPGPEVVSLAPPPGPARPADFISMQLSKYIFCIFYS